MPKINQKKIETSEENPSDVLNDLLIDTEVSLRAMGTGKKASLAGLSLKNFLDQEASLALPLNHILLQYVFAENGFNVGTAIEIVGEDGIGKTTMALSLIGMGLRAHPYATALYLNSEGKNKLFGEDRIASCFSTNKKEARSMINTRVRWSEVASLTHALESITNFSRVLRENLDKRGIAKSDSPIFVVIDTLSKLMPKGEAALVGLGDKSGNPSSNSLDETSNLEFSKTLQKWTREMPHILQEYGVCLIIVSHQNTKIEMNSFAARYLTSADLKENNRTKIGGNAVNQSAALQFTLTKGKILMKETSTSKQAIGQVVKLKVVKNSQSIPFRDCIYLLNIDHSEDTDDAWDAPLKFDYGLPEMFIKEHLYGVKVDSVQKDTFTSKPLGLEKVPRQEFIKVLKREDIIADILSDLNIRGLEVPQSIGDISIEEDQVLEGDSSSSEDPEGIVVVEETLEDIDNATSEEVSLGESSQEVPIATIITPKKRGRKPKSKTQSNAEHDL